MCHGSQLKVVGSFQELTLTVLKLPSRILRSSGQCVCLMWCLPPLCVCGFVFELLPKLSKQVTIPATARSDSTTAPQACWFLVLRFLLFCFLCLFYPTPEWGGGAWPQQPSSAVVVAVFLPFSVAQRWFTSLSIVKSTEGWREDTSPFHV